jgi:hypothetical protein
LCKASRNDGVNEIMANAVKQPMLSSRDQFVRNQLGTRYREMLFERIFNKNLHNAGVSAFKAGMEHNFR